MIPYVITYIVINMMITVVLLTVLYKTESITIGYIVDGYLMLLLPMTICFLDFMVLSIIK